METVKNIKMENDDNSVDNILNEVGEVADKIGKLETDEYNIGDVDVVDSMLTLIYKL